MNLLLLSSSKADNTEYLEHASQYLKEHLGDIKEVLFIPYAGVSMSYDDYHQKVKDSLAKLGYQTNSIHQFADAKLAIEKASAIVVGGGNTFCLLNSLYQHDLIDTIRNKVGNGTPYVGWSAGSNITAPTIKTTNDMPIVEPLKFDALNFVPFQINPHYIDINPVGHHGETREMRINEFLCVNPQQTVVGLPEGTALQLKHNNLRFIGSKQGFLFDISNGKQIIEKNSNLNHLLNKAINP